MVSITVETKLIDARDRLFRVSEELLRSGQFPKYEKRHYRRCVRRRKEVANFAGKVSVFAGRLVKTADNIMKRAIRERPPCQEDAQPKPLDEFHRFNQLPAELRTMVWQFACQPPPCKHFLMRSHYMHDLGGPPAASMMEDGGLWTACRESRKVMRQAYDAMHCQVVKTGCTVDDHELEMHYRRLGQFNRSGRALQKQLRAFHTMFRQRINQLGHLPPSRICDLYRTYLPEQGGILLGEGMIRWATLFEQSDL